MFCVRPGLHIKFMQLSDRVNLPGQTSELRNYTLNILVLFRWGFY